MGHGRRIREVAFARLLSSAGFIQNYLSNKQRITEISDGRIIERNMAVFAESHESQINRHCRQQFRIPLHFPIQIGRIAGKVMAHFRMNFFRKASSDPAAEAGRVFGADARILIHVKQFNSVPRNGLPR